MKYRGIPNQNCCPSRLLSAHLSWYKRPHDSQHFPGYMHPWDAVRNRCDCVAGIVTPLS